ncbi:MAG: glycerophosphodiester phosphodiesterase family protein [Pseudomonadota bacterium]
MTQPYRTLMASLQAAVLMWPVLAGAADVGPRPLFLVDQLDPGPLRDTLLACAGQPVSPTRFSIGHRGAPLQFPEHTRESYRAAARMGAGTLECDVTFTADHELVCRHAQNDLHTTTDILVSPLADRCVEPFVPANGDTPARAQCRTSELSLAEFRTLTGKMDAADRGATDVQAYLGGTAGFRTDLYAANGGSLMTHAESIALFAELGVAMTPELKAPAVAMPHDGFSQADYAQKLIDEYKQAGIGPAQVRPQSFNLDDVLYWLRAEPEFGAQAIYLDGRYRDRGFDPARPERLSPSLPELKALGVNTVAPPLWVLLDLEDGRMVPSAYARAAREAGLHVITWTLERSGPLAGGGGWYYQSVAPLIRRDSDMLVVLDVLAQDVGVVGVFSDWPATVSYYASCLGLE